MQACLHAVTARDLKKVISAQMGSGTSYSFHPGAILLFNFLGYCLSCSGARAHRSSRSRPGLKIVTPGTVGRFIDRLGPLIENLILSTAAEQLLQSRVISPDSHWPVGIPPFGRSSCLIRRLHVLLLLVLLHGVRWARHPRAGPGLGPWRRSHPVTVDIFTPI